MPTIRIEHHLPTEQVLQVCEGDLTEETTDAIVNAANEYLLHGGGVAGAILRRGGDSIQEESEQYTDTFGPVPTRQVAVTGAGELATRYIIHAVGPIWNDGQHGEANLLRDAIWNSLSKAEELHLTSIALPAISSGIFGFPKEQCASILITTTLEFCVQHPTSTLRLIRFTNIDQLTTNLLQTALQIALQAEK